MQSKQQAIRTVRQEAHAYWNDMKEEVIQLQNENSMLMSFGTGRPPPSCQSRKHELPVW